MNATDKLAGGEGAARVLRTMLPVRFITYAWGERYVDALLSFTLPAALSPGNVPYVASQTACEVVIVTEERFFPLFRDAPVVARLLQHCPVRLVSLDDLITAPSRYGMALTYAVHRAFVDLGSEMTNHWLMFVNSDFILADGCLREVLHRLQDGARIVAAPSYCVNANEVVPELRQCVDPVTGAITIANRDMAKIILDHRHNTIRGKTINQSAFHLHYMDQFYWLLDGQALLSHQMPIAIAGLRPEREVREPTALWDHGAIAELCPEAEPCVIGDSDQFVMLALRDNEVAQDQIMPGAPQVRELGERMIAWVTPYQRDMAKYELTLHVGDLPPDAPAARVQLRNFVSSVLSFAPADLPSHIDHPQWDYHWPAFMEARHKFLSGRLGSLTTSAPPSSLSRLDRSWWIYDGAIKAEAEKKADIDACLKRQLRYLESALENAERSTSEREIQLSADLIAPTKLPEAIGDSAQVFSTLSLQQQVTEPVDEPPSVADIQLIRNYELKHAELEAQLRSERERIRHATAAAHDLHRLRLQVLEQEYRPLLEELHAGYSHLLKKRVVEPLSPFAKMRQGPAMGKVERSLRSQLVRVLYDVLYGPWPRVRILNPYWAATHPLIRAVDGAVARGAQNVLFVGDNAGITDNLVNLPGLHAWTSAASLSGSISTFGSPYRFDLCVCDLDSTDISRFSDLYEEIRRAMRPSGTIVAFYFNADTGPRHLHWEKVTEEIGRMPGAEIHVTGSRLSASAMRAFRKLYAAQKSRKFGISLLAFGTLALLTPYSLLANLLWLVRREAPIAETPAFRPSITIKVALDQQAKVAPEAAE
jgi:hypothetical protein